MISGVDLLQQAGIARAEALGDVLEREFPGALSTPGRIRNVVALRPFRNADPRDAVAVEVDGTSFVVVDGRPELFPVHERSRFAVGGSDVQVLSIPSHKWRRFYVPAPEIDDEGSGGVTSSATRAALTVRLATGSPSARTLPTSSRAFDVARAVLWWCSAFVTTAAAASLAAGSPSRRVVEVLVVAVVVGSVVMCVRTIRVWRSGAWS